VGIVRELAAHPGLGVLADALGLEVASDPLGRGVGSDELGEGPLEVFELIHEVVIVIIAYDRGIVHIIPAAVVPDDLAELVYPSFSLFFLHTVV
jgi:hypothetical protein